MSITVALRHRTEYHFDRRVGAGPHVVRLRPAPHGRTPIESYSLRIEPGGHFLNWLQDPFGNYLARLVFPEPIERLIVDVEVVARLVAINPFDFFLEPEAEHFPFGYDPALAKQLAPYFERERAGSRFERYLASVPRVRQRTIDFLVGLNQQLSRDVAYTIRLEPGVQTPEETLELGRGSCRDSAWLLVQLLRHLGLAARFVSGYLVQLAPDEPSLDGPSGPVADFTDLHAWCEVYVPGAGWIGLDPTSGLFASEGHIPLACTPHYQTAAAIEGAVDRCETEFRFANEVFRLREVPRVTRPYAEPDWQAIDALGRSVDADLAAAGVRLTQGGEPTFVSVDDFDAPEWNTEALDRPGQAQKWTRALDLTQRLQTRFAPGGLIQQGQGKWYPGEPLPRWLLGLYWRSDGQPLWRDPRWLAQAGAAIPAAGSAELPRDFLQALASRLRVSAETVLPAFEDGLYLLWQEARTAINLDPEQPTADELLRRSVADRYERSRLAELLSRGIETPRGWVLPLAWDWWRAGWYSAVWTFRRGALYLIPGDSPLGLRLPLDALPWRAQEPLIPEPDPFAETDPLPKPDDRGGVGEVAARFSHFEAVDRPLLGQPLPRAARASQREVEVPHTALSAEWRDGQLCLFLPPVAAVEHYLDLIAAIEDTAAAFEVPVVLEGYPPPFDSRLKRLAVTPDPGVIEVNIHPAASWQELQDTTLALYEEARAARLTSFKFMHDGRQVGTGGGNHVTLGGPTPAESPLVRRPGLLLSLLTYWQHHPGLSYLFPGLFIGPPVRRREWTRGGRKRCTNWRSLRPRPRWARPPCPGWVTGCSGIC